MHWHRIWALVTRYLLLPFVTFDRFSSVVYWPLIGIATWGLAGVWFEQTARSPAVLVALLANVCLWQIVVRTTIETAKCVYVELVNANLVNLFATPFCFIEWVVAMTIVGILNMVLVLLASAGLVYLIYQINIFTIGWAMIPLVFLLLISGLFIGFILCGLLIYFGKNMQELMYMVVWGCAPFCAVYYPLSVMPVWSQYVAAIFPMTYIFEGVRQLLIEGALSKNYLLISLFLNCLYLLIALIFFKFMFEKSRSKGLARLQ
jgi:ABC-2 type transport system permease protein